MKKITLTIFLTFIINNGFSQILYSNYLDITSEWRNISGGWNGFSGYSNYTTTYFDGLETINGQVYYRQFSKNLYSSTGFGGNPITELTLSGPTYIREDLNGKFYQLDSNNLSLENIIFDNQQILLAQIGDAYPYPGATCTIQSIQNVNLGSTNLKKINGSIINNTRGSIEGIGHIGLACATGIEYNSNLNCYTKQGITLQFGTENCNSFPVPIRVNLNINASTIQENRVNIYPNPTNGNFKIKSPESLLNKNYKIYDIYGALINENIFREIEQEINITNLSNGIYFLKINDGNISRTIKIMKK